MSEQNRVVLPEAFRKRLGEDHIKRLEAQGVSIDPYEVLENYDLKPIQFGEKQVGRLDREELMLFCRAKDSGRAAMALQKTIEVRQYRANADLLERMKEGEANVPAPNVVTREDIRSGMMHSEIAEAYTQMVFVAIRTRLDLWHDYVAVRASGAIVVVTGKPRTATGCDE